MRDTTTAAKTEGALLLALFLTRNGITQVTASEALRVRPPSIHEWLSGKKRPEALMRRRIARWTVGAVPEASWETPEERSSVEVVQPFAARIQAA